MAWARRRILSLCAHQAQYSAAERGGKEMPEA